MTWIKKGILHTPQPQWWWSKSFAGLPTATMLNEDTIRVYYYSVDEKMDGRISYIDVSAANPSRVLYVHPHPVLDIGEPGFFDDCGVCPSCYIEWRGEKRLYYVGVQRSEKVPYYYFAGLAIQNANGNFERVQRTPILERTSVEPFVRSATTIVVEGNELKMWYVSADKWINIASKRVPSYKIHHAISTDGVNWNKVGGVCFEFTSEDEYGFGRPWVIHEDGVYKMWYSVRTISLNYRIGYAESKDGISWVRKDDEVGIDISESGFDHEMICYPSVIKVNGKKYMFHNGNAHGAVGFGYSEWQE